jgi:uncharacterized protein (TIGR02996 family)
MDPEAALLAALHDNPCDQASWSALADWLEEKGEGGRAELVRLRLALRAAPRGERRKASEARQRELLAAGTAPRVPELVNSLGMRLALVPPGKFRMGSPQGERHRYPDEGPRHEVEITRAFYLGVFPVTQAEYERVTGMNPSHFAAGGQGAEAVSGLDTRDFPVDSVSWRDAVAFCEKLSALPEEKLAGRKYRLPTEAEWEYACRAGVLADPFHFGASASGLEVNFDGDHPPSGGEEGPFLGRTTAVGSYRPNAWGLYDLHGNVCEWCSDWFDEDYYSESPKRNPQGPDAGTSRVLRGGCWNFYGWNCRTAYRGNNAPGYRHYLIGFRVALTSSSAS